MRLILRIDGFVVQIDTRDPELMARWLLEQFSLIRWTPATTVTAQAWPGFYYQDEIPAGATAADWLADSRYIGQAWKVKSPRDVADRLSAAVDAAEQGNP